jgi:TonB family protein
MASRSPLGMIRRLTTRAIPLLLITARLDAQGGAVISGRVVDTLGAPIIGAAVRVGESRSALTNDVGAFRIPGVSVAADGASPVLSVRRLGFLPTSIVLSLGSSTMAESLAVRLIPVPTALKPVVVQTRRVEYSGRLAGYYQRLEKRNAGYFITREQIDRENPRMLVHLLQRVPGVTPARGRFGVSGVRFRGRNCAPVVWLDGTPMPAGEVDLDSFSPQTIHGIEIYEGSTTAPARFVLTRDVNSCGTVVLWSRGPDTDPITSTHRPVQDLEQLIASAVVYSANQVDSAAQLKTSAPIEYPPSLFAAGVNGSVVAEFVVAANGTVEEETIGIVSSTNALFSESAKAAVRRALFVPALKNGKPVRQLVQQPIIFLSSLSKTGRADPEA